MGVVRTGDKFAKWIGRDSNALAGRGREMNRRRSRLPGKSGKELRTIEQAWRCRRGDCSFQEIAANEFHSRQVYRSRPARQSYCRGAKLS